jgi:predicted porin
MNKNIKLAVAGAVLALSATAANAGIIIPAGEWTVDIGGNVNTYATWTKTTAHNQIMGGLVGGTADDTVGAISTQGTHTVNNLTTGLLPHFLSVSGSTRQNDLDVAFTISIQPGTSNTGAFGNQSGQNNRQAFMSFGDKSWGSVKLGKDLGIFASDAILSDISLLGVGASTVAGNNTTLGRIGSGYLYADWKPQIAYTTPNFNGLQATVGITQAWNQVALGNNGIVTTTRGGAAPAYEGKASYSFSANDVTGKIWVSGIAQKNDGVGAGVIQDDSIAYAGDIGANVNFAGFGLTGYYYGGSGVGTSGQMSGGYATVGGHAKQRDSDGGYVQATYILPTKTKAAVSYGESNLDYASGETDGLLVKSNSQWLAGLYHPLTKHLNLVAEYTHVEAQAQNNATNKANTGSLGAILFF